MPNKPLPPTNPPPRSQRAHEFDIGVLRVSLKQRDQSRQKEAATFSGVTLLTRSRVWFVDSLAASKKKKKKYKKKTKKKTNKKMKKKTKKSQTR